MMRLIVLFVALLVSSCSSPLEDKRNESPNFKDGEFHNTNHFEFHSFSEMLMEAFNSEDDTERAQWPESVLTLVDKAPVDRVSGQDIRVTYVNHATFLVQIAGLNILTDPVFSERTSPVSFIGPKRIHQPGIDIVDLPKIDIVLISHDHYDHLDLASIEQIAKRDNAKVFMGLGVRKHLDDEVNAIEMDWWDSAVINDKTKVWFVEVQHFSGRTLMDRNETLWGGFLIEINGKKIYFGGDSGYANHYEKTFDKFGQIDVAFLPIGAYAPRKLFKPIHLDPAEAVQAHLDLQAKLSIGMHYGTFQLSAEPYAEPIELLNKAKQERSVANSSFITLEIGKPINLNDLLEL